MKRFFNVFLICLIFLMISCTDKNKEILNPNFDSEIEFRLSEKIYSVEDIAKKQSQITVDLTSPKKLLKFKTDELRKDTVFESFFADVFLEMNQDTTITFGQSDTINIEMIVQRDSVRIEEADLNSGSISYKVINYSSFPGQFKLQFIGLTKVSGSNIDTLSVSGILTPFGTIEQILNLEGYNYVLPPNQPFRSSRPGFWVKGKFLIEGVNVLDSIGLKASVTNISFNRIKGNVKPISFGKKVQTINNSLSNNLKDFIKGVTFDSLRVTIKGGTTIKGFPIAIKKFKVYGLFNNSFQESVLHFKDQFGNFKDFLDTVFLPSQTMSFVFDKNNTDIGQFISEAPDSLKIESELVLNPIYNRFAPSGEISANDSLKISFFAEAWSRWKIQSSDFYDTIEVEISDDVRQKLLKSSYGELTINLINSVPLEGNIKSYFLDKNKQPLFINGNLFYLTKNFSNDSVLSFVGANVNSNGDVISPSSQTIKKVLTAEETIKLKDAYFIKSEYIISTTNSNVVYISANDSISLITSGKIKVNLNNDDLKK